jgi:hypothetical protein
MDFYNCVPLAKEEKGMSNRLTEIVRSCGMEMKEEKSKVVRISRQPSPTNIMIDQKQLKKVEYFKYLGSAITKDT